MTEWKSKRSRVPLLFARLLFFVVRGFDISGPREDIVLLFLFVPDDDFRGFQGIQWSFWFLIWRARKTSYTLLNSSISFWKVSDRSIGWQLLCLYCGTKRWNRAAIVHNWQLPCLCTERWPCHSVESKYVISSRNPLLLRRLFSVSLSFGHFLLRDFVTLASGPVLPVSESLDQVRRSRDISST